MMAFPEYVWYKRMSMKVVWHGMAWLFGSSAVYNIDACMLSVRLALINSAR